jgi:hypothetical protein
MTMQLGMIGSDGIVLASDTRHTVSPLYAGSGARHHYGASKIKIDSTGKIAVACSGDMDTAKAIADRIFSDPTVVNDPHHREQRIWDIGNAIANGQDAECIVAFSDSRLYFFQSANDGRNIQCLEITDSIHAGDGINAATFWTTRYYRRLPARRLLRLAAFVIFAAHKIANGGIKGLEMVYWDGTKFLRLSGKENRNWEAKARNWEKKIGRFILGYGNDASL